jgi:ABC-type bacteriocin/lantibiotic exporter with double-glycine peptidase domain
MKAPVILQLEMVECGAASLAMVMAYHKKWLPLERLRADCGVSRDGSSARAVVQVARLYGFTAKGYRIEPENLMSLPMPCILHWNLNHFVVLRGLGKKYAYLNDPASGEVKLPIAQFNESYTGIALSITPGPGFTPSGKPPSVAAFAKKRLRGTAPVFAFVLCCAGLTAACGVLATLFNRVLIDDMLAGKYPELAYGFAALFLAFNILIILLKFLEAKTSLKIAAKFAVVSSGMFLWHALRLPLDFYASRHSGDIA